MFVRRSKKRDVPACGNKTNFLTGVGRAGDDGGTTSLREKLVDTSTASDDSNGSTGRARHGLLRTRGETDAGLVVLGRVTKDSRVVAWRACV